VPFGVEPDQSSAVKRMIANGLKVKKSTHPFVTKGTIILINFSFFHKSVFLLIINSGQTKV